MQNKYKMSLSFLDDDVVKAIIIRESLKKVLEINHLPDETFAMDLNPHRTVEFVLKKVCSLVQAEGLPCQNYDVALLWLTDELVSPFFKSK